MRTCTAIVAAACVAAAVTAMPCPGSKAGMHASCQVESTIAAACGAVAAEVTARINGQPGKWTDPHNNGTYTLDSSSATSLAVHRVTGNGDYTDKMTFTLTDSGSSCNVQACSESQVTSVADASTNYCNTRNLLCGAGDGCKPVLHDAAYSETNVKPSFGAGSSKGDCLK
jgi:hypothetical protein